MSYTISLSNGNLLTTIPDGTIDNSTTDLSLIGKNFTSYGQQLNENFVYLLENFAGVAQPTIPLIGQLWYDSPVNGLKVYTPTGWRTAGGPIVSDQEPLVFNTGDFWVDNLEDQLWFHTGTDLVLAGPIWKKSQGKTGFVADTIYDSTKNPRSILYLYISNTLMGIYAADNFNPSPPISGFSNGLNKGYTPNSNVSSIIGGTTSNSILFNNLATSQFMRSDIPAENDFQLLIKNDLGISVGQRQAGNFRISNTSLVIENVLNQGSILVQTQNTTGTYTPIYINGSTNQIGIWTVTPQQALDVAGNLRVRGDLIVEGTNTRINSTILTVDDKNLELAVVSSKIIATSATITAIIDNSPPLSPGSGPWTLTITNLASTVGLTVGERIESASGTGNLGNGNSVSILTIISATTLTVTSVGSSVPISGTINQVSAFSSSDIAADGGGIVIKGTTDKSILYQLSTRSFNSSENFNLSAGKVFSIGGVQILSASSLSPSVTSATGLTTIGSLTSLTAGTISISNNMISATVANQDIEINPNGSGNIVLVSRVINGSNILPRITGLGFPVNLTDAVPKYYVTGAIQQSPIALTFIDNGLSGSINSSIILMLNDVAQPSLYIDGKYAYVHVQHIGTGSPPNVTRYLKRFIIRNSVWIFDSDLTSSI